MSHDRHGRTIDSLNRTVKIYLVNFSLFSYEKGVNNFMRNVSSLNKIKKLCILSNLIGVSDKITNKLKLKPRITLLK